MPTITPGVTPIQFSDWDALYSTLDSVVGPIPVDSGGNFFTGSAGNGYGLDPDVSLSSSPYPFEKIISTISRTNPAQVTTTLPHRFETGDLVYINGLPGAWSTSPLEGQYFQVQSTGANTFQLLNTFLTDLGLPAYPSSTSGKVTQPIVHQSQFNRIKTDIDNVWEHLFNNRTSGTVVPTRNTLIQGSVYNSFYNALSTISSKKLVLGKAINLNKLSQTRETTWGDNNDGLGALIKVTFPTLSAFYQYFNTGGLIVFDMNITKVTASGAQASKEQDWENLINAALPYYYGGFNKAILGYDSTTFPPGRSTPLVANSLDAGAFDATVSGYTKIFEKFGGGINSRYTSNYITIEHQRDGSDLRSLNFRIIANDTVVNAFTTGVSADVELTVNLIYTTDPIPLSFDPSPALGGVQVVFNGDSWA